MPAKAPLFRLFFEIIFLESYSQLTQRERKAIDKSIKLLAANPRHPSLHIHKARNVNAKYPEGGDSIFIAYATKELRFTFEYGPEPGTISLRNCGHHNKSERKM